MHRSILLAAILGGISSSAFGGFTITATRTTAGLPAGLQQIDLYALNTGNGTGTGLLTFDLTMDGTTGSRAFFRSSTTGIPQVINSSDTANRSYFRIDDDDSMTSAIVSRTPAGTWTLAPDQGPSTVGQEDFQVALVATGSAKPANTGVGAHFAQLIVTQPYNAVLTGSIGGDRGGSVAVNFALSDIIVDPPYPFVISPPQQTVTFGNVVSGGLPFSATVTASGGDSIDSLNLSTGTLPAGVSNILVTKSFNAGVTSFVVTGLLNYSTNKTDVTIPVNVTDGVSSSTGAISLHIVPEPTSIAILGSLALVGRRRRSARRGDRCIA